MMVAWLFLLLPSVLSLPFSCHDCDENCRNRYSIASLGEACVFGCHSSVGLNARTDEFGVNLDCEQKCSHFEDSDSKSACFVGCTYIAPLEIVRPQSGPSPIFDALSGPIMKIFSFLSLNDNGQPEQDQVPVRESHIRLVVPKEPSHMMDDSVYVIMNVIHDSNDESPTSFHIMPVSSNDDGSEMPSFARTFCRRAHIALHNLAAHPLFLVSVILMFVISATLLVFACVRLSARRARCATFQRQYRRMPAFFKPASVKVSLLTPQPTFEDEEAPELPPKESIDKKAPMQWTEPSEHSNSPFA
ncbi:hypothetical protein EGR_02604 [Echinococcus granulosus]|uniref:Expressed conserved protein n=1 Tax=Echinococcus granulosus TaxID=6210 RepID=U6IZ92_ECHGR|nr:hypothetical protein EGR_02604 [Echinococcus granulosus]EUB62472.1 hypothetical protein EGR_02604 [Echinococcus granulosus]CDS17058.1 expressed conserved protein [Echinococcus granulosus]